MSRLNPFCHACQNYHDSVSTPCLPRPAEKSPAARAHEAIDAALDLPPLRDASMLAKRRLMREKAHAALDEAMREARRQGGEMVLAEAIKRVCPMCALGVKAYRASGGEFVHNIGGAQPCRSAYLYSIPFEEAKDANQG